LSGNEFFKHKHNQYKTINTINTKQSISHKPKLITAAFIFHLILKFKGNFAKIKISTFYEK